METSQENCDVDDWGLGGYKTLLTCEMVHHDLPLLIVVYRSFVNSSGL